MRTHPGRHWHSPARAVAAPLRVRRNLLLPLLLASLVIAGCSAVRTAYNQADVLARWWIEEYVDLQPEQASRVKQALKRELAWHRQHELPELARLLGLTRRTLTEAVTRQDVQILADGARTRLFAAVEHALPEIAEIALTLTPTQLAHLEKMQAESNLKFRKEYLDGTEERQKRRLCDRVIEQTERVYGKLLRDQEETVRSACLARPHNPGVQLADRIRRQQDIVATLRRIQADRMERAEATEALRALMRRYEVPPNPEHAAFKRELMQANQELIVLAANGATPKQRALAQKRLQGWIDDLAMLGGKSLGNAEQARAP